MGLVWDYVDSANFQSGLRRDLDVWDAGLSQWNSRLQTLISYLGYGPGVILSSEAYNTVKTLFQDRILPIVASGQVACIWTRIHLSEYKIAEEPLLDDGGRVEEDAVQATIDSLDKEIHDMTYFLDFHEWWKEDYDDVKNLRTSRNAIYDELGELRTFSAAVSGLFQREVVLTQTLADSISSINHGTLGADGSYTPALGDAESWLGSLQQYIDTAPKPVFDVNGQYGGDQRTPPIQWNSLSDEAKQRILDIIHKYFPNAKKDFNDSEIGLLLEELAKSGCGYMADVNAIAEHFENDPEGFEEAFGYPLYDESGNINYTLIFVDFWCYVQSVNNYDLTGQVGIEPQGIFPTEGTFINDYLAQHGVTITTDETRNATMDDYVRMSQEGSVSISMRPVRMHDKDGKKLTTTVSQHAAIVTGQGVDPDGRRFLIVASWGDQYRVYPDEYEGVDDFNQYFRMEVITFD